MKKIISLMLVSSLVAFPTASFGAGDPAAGTYKNKGQCESALKTARNDIRAALKDVFPPNDVNQAFRENLACVQAADGTWSIQFI